MTENGFWGVRGNHSVIFVPRALVNEGTIIKGIRVLRQRRIG